MDSITSCEARRNQSPSSFEWFIDTENELRLAPDSTGAKGLMQLRRAW